MNYTKKNTVLWLVVLALAAGVLIGCKKQPQSQQVGTESNELTQQKQTSSAESNTKPTLRNIIARAKGWAPVYANWYGKEAPDFTVTDITGKMHRLSEYKGRNVMLIFWATWCGPCISEIPHLIELRETFGEDKLAMLAISYTYSDPTEKVKKFVAANPIINYTVISTDIAVMPRPYNLINAIPCSFFIDPEGKIKLATSGTIPLRDMKGIIEAER